jgi:polyisoprenoid-binding protein YceI
MRRTTTLRLVHGAQQAALIAFVLTALSPAFSHAAFTRAGAATVRFTATGPAGLKFAGNGSELSVREADGKVTVSIPLASLDTAIELRNRHMRDKYLEVQTHPNAVLVAERARFKLTTNSGEERAELTLHGRTRPVLVKYTIERAADGTLKVEGSTRIDMREFGIEVPSYLGVAVKPEVDVAVSFTVVDR